MQAQNEIAVIVRTSVIRDGYAHLLHCRVYDRPCLIKRCFVVVWAKCRCNGVKPSIGLEQLQISSEGSRELKRLADSEARISVSNAIHFVNGKGHAPLLLIRGSTLGKVSGEIVQGVAHEFGLHGFYLPDWRGKESRRTAPTA
jgi:hypothetical protein